MSESREGESRTSFSSYTPIDRSYEEPRRSRNVERRANNRQNSYGSTMDQPRQDIGDIRKQVMEELCEELYDEIKEEVRQQILEEKPQIVSDVKEKVKARLKADLERDMVYGWGDDKNVR